MPNCLLGRLPVVPSQALCEPFPHEAGKAERVLSGFSSGLFKAKTATRRQRLHWISQPAPRRRRNIAETSGRASSSPSPTQPASGALPLSQARPQTSSCLVGSRGKSKCPLPGPGVSFSSSPPPSFNIQGSCVLGAFYWPALRTPQDTKPSKVSALRDFYSGGETSSKRKSKQIWDISV